MNLIDRSELIDRYLLGNISADDKNQLERLLSNGDSSCIEKKNLNDEMNLQKEIIFALKRKGLKEQLRKEEEKIRKEKMRKHRVLLLSFSGGSTFALAAVLLLLLTIAPLSRVMFQCSESLVSEISLDNLRGDTGSDSISNNIVRIVLLMKENQWLQAEQLIESTHSLLSYPLNDYMQERYDELEWYTAICYMHDKKIFKAKKMLNKIAKSDSFYSKRAQNLLDDF